MIYCPVLFSLVERVGDGALIAPNGVVAGDTFGNGHLPLARHERATCSLVAVINKKEISSALS